METGTVAHVVVDKGYGFISPAGGRDDVFFHAGELVGIAFDEQLQRRDVVFDVAPGRDGRQRAINVRPAR